MFRASVHYSCECKIKGEKNSFNSWVFILNKCNAMFRVHWNQRSVLWCKNVNISTCSGARLALFLETMFPAEEKRRSEGVDVAGTHK